MTTLSTRDLANLTDFCRVVLSPGDLLPSSNSCSVTAFSDRGPIDGWLLYASQIGYSNGHMILAVFLIIIAIASLSRLLLHYKRMLGGLDWESLSEFQNLHILLHLSSAVLGLLAFLSGFITNILNAYPAWIMLSSLTETLLFGTQVILTMIIVRLWLAENDMKIKSLKWMAAILYFPLSLLYIICICSYGGRAIAADATFGQMAQFLAIMIDIVRYLLGVIGIVYALQRHEDAFHDFHIISLTGVVSVITCIYSTLSILFTLGIFCPNFGFRGSLWFRFYEWYYFLALSALVLYFGCTLAKALGHGKETWTRLEESVQTFFGRDESSPTIVSSPDMLTSPVRAFLERNNATEISAQTLVPESSSPLMSQKAREDEVHRKRVLSITSWIGSGLGLCVSALFLLDIYYFRNPEVGLKTCILTTACIAIASHFFTASFRPSPPTWGKYDLVPSVFFGMVFIAASVIAVQLTGTFGIYYACTLWPIITWVVSCDSIKALPDTTAKMVNPDTLSNQPTKTEVFGTGIIPLQPKPSVPVGTLAWRFFRTFTFFVILSTWIISLVSGLYLPLALSTIVVSSSFGITSVMKFKDKWVYLASLISSLGVILLACVAIVSIAPVFMRKSYDTNSLRFIQRYGKPYSSLDFPQNVSGIFIDSQFSRKLAENEDLYDDWLSTLASSKSQLFFDVKGSSNHVKYIAKPFCSKPYPFTPAFIVEDLSLLLALWKLGLNEDVLLYKQPIEAQVTMETSYGKASAYSTIFDLRSVLLNPYSIASTRYQNKSTFVEFNEDEDSDIFVALTKLLGSNADIVGDANRARSIFGDSGSRNSTASDVAILQPTTPATVYESSGGSLLTAWIVAVVFLPALILCLSLGYGFYRKATGISSMVLDQSIHVFGYTVNIQKAIEQSVLLMGLLAGIGWLIFVIGGGGLILANNRTLDPSGLTFLFATIGLTSCLFSIIVTIYSHRYFMLLHTIFLTLTLISAGSVVEGGLNVATAYPGSRLMTIGAGLCSVFLAIAAGLVTSRQSRVELENDYLAQGASTLCSIGWILVVVAVARISIESQVYVDFSYIALTVAGFPGTCLVFLSTFQYNQWLSSSGIALSTLSLAFSGGVLSNSGQKLQFCSYSTEICAYYWSVAFAGSFLYLVGAFVCLITRLLQNTKIEDNETQIVAQIQIKDYFENLEESDKDVEGILEVLRPNDPRNDNVYDVLTLSKLWIPWKIITFFCFVSWTIYLGALGSMADLSLPTEVTVASIAFAIFAPFGLVGLVYALIHNSRKLMASTICVCSIAMLSGGRMLGIPWINPYGSWVASVAGISLFISFFSVAIGLIFFRMKLFINSDEKIAPFSSRLGFVVYSSFLLSTIGIIICSTGTGVLYDSQDLMMHQIRPIVFIMAIVLALISLCLNAVTFHLLLREGIDSKGSGSNGWLWPNTIIITSNVAIYIATLTSYLPIGCILHFVSGRISGCNRAVPSCLTGTTPLALIIVGSLLYIGGSLTFLVFVTLNSRSMKFDGDVGLHPVQKRELQPLTKKHGDIDLYTMVLASPILQQRLKICIGLYVVSFFSFIVPFGSFATTAKLSTDVGIVIPFAFSSLATPILLAAWIIVGNRILQYVSLFVVLIGVCFAGYLVSWGLFFGLAYPASITTSALLYLGVTSIITMGYLSWFSFRDTNMYFSTVSKYIFGFAELGWITFIAGFILEHLALIKTIKQSEQLSGWLFVVSGFFFTGFYYLQSWSAQFIRFLCYCSLGIAISFGGAVFISALKFSSSGALMTYTILKIVGSAIYVVLMTSFILHKSIVSFIDLTVDEVKELTCQTRLTPREKELHWIHQPQYRNCLIMYFIWILFAMAGIFVLVISFSILGDVGNSLLTHTFFVAICVSSVSHLVYIYLRWESFGWFYVISTCVASCTCGPAVSYSINVASSSIPFAVVIGCVLAIFGNTAIFDLLICDMKTCEARWFIICIKTVIGLGIVGLLFNIVGLAVNTSKTLIPAALSVSLPGLCAILYIIFIYIWRPEAPKVKSLAELFGYTIVKKKDLEEALTSDSTEKLDIEEKKKKNPVFKVLIKKPKPKPIVERKTINEWLRLIFSSQQTAFSLVVASMFVHGMTAQAMGAQLEKDGSNGSSLQTYLLFFGSMLSLATLMIYIVVLAITCLIDETNVIENARPEPLTKSDTSSLPNANHSQDIDDSESNKVSIDAVEPQALPSVSTLPLISHQTQNVEPTDQTKPMEDQRVKSHTIINSVRSTFLGRVDEYENSGSSDDEAQALSNSVGSNPISTYEDPSRKDNRIDIRPSSSNSDVIAAQETSGSKWIKKDANPKLEQLSLEDIVEYT